MFSIKKMAINIQQNLGEGLTKQEKVLVDLNPDAWNGWKQIPSNVAPFDVLQSP